MSFDSVFAAKQFVSCFFYTVCVSSYVLPIYRFKIFDTIIRNRLGFSDRFGYVGDNRFITRSQVLCLLNIFISDWLWKQEGNAHFTYILGTKVYFWAILFGYLFTFANDTLVSKNIGNGAGVYHALFSRHLLNMCSNVQSPCAWCRVYFMTTFLL